MRKTTKLNFILYVVADCVLFPFSVQNIYVRPDLIAGEWVTHHRLREFLNMDGNCDRTVITENITNRLCLELVCIFIFYYTYFLFGLRFRVYVFILQFLFG